MAQPGTTANHANVTRLATELSLDEAASRRAMEIAGLIPAAAAWRRYIDYFLMALGVALILTGAAAFLAWNWADLGRMSKFALLQGGIVLTVVAAWRLGLDSVAGRAGLLAAAILVGLLLALYGQVYQTGADPYGLFLTWAIMVLPLVLIGRQAGLWLLLVVLANLTLILYWTQVLNPPEGWWQLAQLLGPIVWLGSTVMDSTLASYLFALNVVVVALWEYGSSHGSDWMRGRWFPRVVSFGAFVTVLIPTLIMIFAASLDGSPGLTFVSPLLFFLAVGVSVYFYQYCKLDLFILTIAVFGSIMVIMSYAIREMFKGFGSALPLAALLIGLVAAAAWWLREVAHRWELRE